LHIKKKSAIIDFLAKQPTILSRACIRENILSGYVTAGLVDPIHFCMPVLLKIMGTVKGHGHGIGGKDIPVMAHLAKARRWSKR